MILSSIVSSKISSPKVVRKPRSLSHYFPKDTQYFYGYPAGEGSDFVNLVPPDIEELVAARAFCCAGNKVSVVCFAATNDTTISERTRRALKLPKISKDRQIILPDKITADMKGGQRNQAIEQALLEQVQPGHFMMAQPFTDDSVQHLYQIKPELSYWLNDKNNLTQFIDSSRVPGRLAEYTNGAEFAESWHNLPLPYVVKVSASSSGDGVYLCRTTADAEEAVQHLQKLTATIIVEQFIDAIKSYGIHFGIPADPSKPIDIIGINEQLTSADGAFLGGVIRSITIPEALQEATHYFVHEALPRVRELGWYGVGGIDVLVDRDNKVYFIDGNFRMTAMSAYHFLVNRKEVRTPLLSFNGTFEGDEEALVRALTTPLHKGNTVRIISMTHHDNTWRFNGAICYTDESSLAADIATLLDRDVHSEALTQVIQGVIG